MSELSPPGGSERYEACDDEGRGLPDAPYLPPGGKVARPQPVTDEGATDWFVLGGHTGPPLRIVGRDPSLRGGPQARRGNPYPP